MLRSDKKRVCSTPDWSHGFLVVETRIAASLHLTKQLATHPTSSEPGKELIYPLTYSTDTQNTVEGGRIGRQVKCCQPEKTGNRGPVNRALFLSFTRTLSLLSRYFCSYQV